MKKYIIKYIGLLAGLFALSGQALAQPQFSLTDGVYRIPYADGTTVNTNRDHNIHTPAGAYDLAGTGGGPYQVVAAADGVIRAIDDVHDDACSLPNCGCNNYVWIEHPNGEWSKYTHMSQGSVTGNDWAVGDTICAGDILGPEDDIGCASGDHLHFEIGRPFDLTNPFTIAGGFMGGAGLGDYLIPIVCGVSDYIMHNEDDGLTANPCDTDACPDNIDLVNNQFLVDTHIVRMAGQVTAMDNVTFASGSAGLFQASSAVVLSAGFTAQAGSEFVGRIGPCNTPPWGTGDCMSGFTNPNPPSSSINAGSSGSANRGAGTVQMRVYPSPFSDGFEVEFYLAEDGPVTLGLYDLSGHLVQTLADGSRLPKGEHSIDIKTPDLIPGIYVLRGMINEEMKTKRVVKAW